MKHEYSKWVVALGFAALPFFFWPWASIAHEVPKVALTRWLIVVFGIVSIASVVSFPRRRSIRRSILVGTLSFLGVAIVASFLGVDPMKSFWGNPYRDDGLLTLAHLIGFALMIALVWQSAWEHIVRIAIASGAVVVSSWAVLDGIRWFVFHDVSVSKWGGAIGVSFGNPNFLAGYLLVTFPILLSFALRDQLIIQRRVVSALLVFLQCAAIVLTRSWIGIGGMTLILTWVFTRRVLRSNVISALCLVVLLVVLSSVFIRKMTLLGFLPGGRERIVRSIVNGIAERPLLGYGWANVDYAFKENPWPMRFGYDVYVDKAHSSLLEVAAATGVIGFVAYSALLLSAMQRLRHAVWFFPFLVLVLHMQTNVISISEELLFWFMIGIAMSGRGINAA